MKLSLTTLLTVLFIGLKLTDYIDWSWVWVLSPLWITAIIYVFCIILFCVIAAYTGSSIKITKSKKNENN